MEWCWSWNSSTLATSCEELTHWKRLWCWEGLGAGAEGDDRGWDGWMASLTRWTWVWVNSGRWWWTGRPGVLRFMGSQRVGHDWATELTELIFSNQVLLFWIYLVVRQNQTVTVRSEFLLFQAIPAITYASFVWTDTNLMSLLCYQHLAKIYFEALWNQFLYLQKKVFIINIWKDLEM